MPHLANLLGQVLLGHGSLARVDDIHDLHKQECIHSLEQVTGVEHCCKMYNGRIDGSGTVADKPMHAPLTNWRLLSSEFLMRLRVRTVTAPAMVAVAT